MKRHEPFHCISHRGTSCPCTMQCNNSMGFKLMAYVHIAAGPAARSLGNLMRLAVQLVPWLAGWLAGQQDLESAQQSHLSVACVAVSQNTTPRHDYLWNVNRPAGMLQDRPHNKSGTPITPETRVPAKNPYTQPRVHIVPNPFLDAMPSSNHFACWRDAAPCSRSRFLEMACEGKHQDQLWAAYGVRTLSNHTFASGWSGPPCLSLPFCEHILASHRKLSCCIVSHRIIWYCNCMVSPFSAYRVYMHLPNLPPSLPHSSLSK